MSTLQDRLNTFYDILKEVESNAINYPKDLATTFINNVEKKIALWQVIDIRKDTAVNSGYLPFITENAFFTTNTNKTTGTAPTVWGATLDVTSVTWLPTSWKVSVNGNIITYTWVSSPNLTWCTNIKFAHIAWTIVKPLFDLPSDYGRALRLNIPNISEWRARPVDERRLADELAKIVSWTTELPLNWEVIYSTLRDEDFIVYGLQTVWDPMELQYIQTPTTLVATTDVSSFPDTFDLSIPIIAVSDMLFHRWEEDRAIKLNNRWVDYLKEALVIYNKKAKETEFGNRVRTTYDNSSYNI